MRSVGQSQDELQIVYWVYFLAKMWLCVAIETFFDACLAIKMTLNSFDKQVKYDNLN